MSFDIALVWANLPMYGQGILVTLKLLLIALAVGLLLAVPLALMRVSRRPWGWRQATAYAWWPCEGCRAARLISIRGASPVADS